MKGEGTRWVPLARYRTLAAPARGGLEAVGDPIHAPGIRRARLSGITSGTVAVQLQESPDEKAWADASSIDSASSQQAVAVSPVRTEWFRVKATLVDGACASLSVDGETEGAEGESAPGGEGAW